MHHAFTSRPAFDQKAARIVQHRRSGRPRALASNGEVYAPRWSVGPRLPLGGIARLLAFAATMKLVAVVGLGATAYDAAIAPLQNGTPVERAAIVLLERGVVTRMVTHHLYEMRDTVRRTLAGV